MKKFPTVVLLPAYGRRYANEEAAIQDWLDGKDFLIEHGPYTSIRDIEMLREQFSEIWMRTAPNGFIFQSDRISG